jgi:hypothetical protein
LCLQRRVFGYPLPAVMNKGHVQCLHIVTVSFLIDIICQHSR